MSVDLAAFRRNGLPTGSASSSSPPARPAASERVFHTSKGAPPERAPGEYHVARGDVPPLMNEPHAALFARRFVNTSLGGLRLAVLGDVAGSVVAAQIAVFLFPVSLALLSTLSVEEWELFSSLSSSSSTVWWLAQSLAAVLVMVFCLVLQAAARYQRSQRDVEGFDAEFGVNPAAEDEEIEISECCSPEGFDFIFPSPRSNWLSLARILAAGVVAFGAVRFMSLDDAQERYSSFWPYVWVGAGWWTVALTLHPLVATPPVEANFFRAGIAAERLGPVSRAFYALIPMTAAFLKREVAADSSVYDAVINADDTFRILFALLPVLWTFGVIPPLDAFFSWLLEQTQVFILGGSPAASDKRLVLEFVYASAAVAGSVLLFNVFDESALFFVAVGSGFVLSTMTIANWRARRRSTKVQPVRPQRTAFSDSEEEEEDEEEEEEAEDDERSSATSIPIKGAPRVAEISEDAEPKWAPFVKLGAGARVSRLSVLTKLVVGVGLTVLGVILHLAGIERIHEDLDSLRGGSTDDLWHYGLAAVWLVRVLVVHLRRPYLLRTIHNPMLDEKLRCCWSCCTSEHDSMMIPRYLINCAQVVYLLSHLAVPSPEDISFWDTLVRAVLICRAFRWIWQSPTSLSELLLVIGADRVFDAEWVDRSEWWDDLTFEGKLFVAAFVWIRAFDLIRKSEFMLVHSVSAATDNKLRLKKCGLVTVLWFALLPVHILALLVSTFIDAPIVPILGAPLFFVGFPRPRRAWPTVGGQFSHLPDTAYYRQMTPELMRTLPALIDCGFGPLGDTVAGDVLMFRLEPYIAFVQVLELGHDYAVVNVKGLELQQTSCHTVEASRLDRGLEDWENSHGSRCARTDADVASTFQLAGTASVLSYSITKNSLTGIIDRRENLQLVSSSFARILVLFLYRLVDGDTNAFPPTFVRSPLQDYDLFPLQNEFPAAFYKYLTRDSPKQTEIQWDPLFKVAMTCFAIIEKLGMGGLSVDSPSVGPAHVANVFAGEIPPSLYETYLTRPQHKNLFKLVIRAYRYAVKAVYDCVALGEMDILTGSSDESLKDFVELVDSYSDWHIGVENPKWNDRIARGGGKLFSIAQKREQGSTKVVSHSFELRRQDIFVGRLNPAALRAFWASLTLELTYFANDDEERYSIQAHKLLLRNLAVQASEPPFGYPVFSTWPGAIAL